MKRSEQMVPVFTCFSQLEPEMQVTVLKKSENYANVQKISTDWYKETSIKSRGMIINVFSFLPRERKVDILLNAVYEKNYDGVESILKHSNILALTNSPYHYVKHSFDGKKVVVDTYVVAEYNNDKKMLDLLHAHNVPQFTEGRLCQPTKLMMTCLAGNSEVIGWYLNETTDNMRNAFAVAIDCDRGECLNILINDLYWDSNTADIMLHIKQIASLLKKNVLRRACETKKIKALNALLASKHFCLNEIENDKTILDEILELTKIDCRYNEVALLLQEYGAKTAEKLAVDAADEQYMLGKLIFPGCVIF